MLSEGVDEMKRRASAGLFAACALALACAPLSHSAPYVSQARAENGAYRVAVAPVTLASQLLRRSEVASSRYADAETHVGHYLAEALLARGVDVVPARDSRGTLADLTRSFDLHSDASRLARTAVKRLDVDALLVVEVTRWSPRNPARRPPVPAAVGFRATLHGGLDGLLLWSGEFSERQVSFFENPWMSLQYPGWGTRWLSTKELARWGARRLAARIPIDSLRR